MSMHPAAWVRESWKWRSKIQAKTLDLLRARGIVCDHIAVGIHLGRQIESDLRSDLHRQLIRARGANNRGLRTGGRFEKETHDCQCNHRCLYISHHGSLILVEASC